MKKRYIFLIVLAMIVVAVGIFAYVNRDNISAIVHGLTTTTEDIEKQKEETNKKAAEAVKEYGVESIRPLTDEESAKLSSGEITEEEAIKLVLGQTDEKNTQGEASSSGTPTNQPGTEPSPEEKAEQKKLKEANEKIAQLVGKMYVLKSRFTSEILEVKGWVLEEYRKLTPEEKKSDTIKMKIGKVAIAEVSALEKDCDAQVEAVLSELSALLTQTGQSTDLVKQIRKAYEEEKQLTKSYYVSKI